MTKRKLDTTFMEPIEIYQLVLNGTLNRFPKGYWERPDSLDLSAKIIRYFIEDVLKWTEDEIKIKLNKHIFRKYKLLGMFNSVYDNSTFTALDTAYPKKYKPWELKITPMGYWNLENAKEATIWLVEEKLKLDINQLKKISRKDFKKYGLTGMLTMLFEQSISRALKNAYSDILPWSFHVTKDYWNTETSREAIKWLVKEVIGYMPTKEEVCSSKMIKIFRENGLSGMTYMMKFNNYQAFKNAYPDIYK